MDIAKEFSKAFYKSVAWKETREYIYNRDKGLCQDCLAKGIVTPGQEVHHIKFLDPNNMNNIDITLGADNLRLLCKECHHNRHNKRKSTDEGFGFDENGNLVKL